MSTSEREIVRLAADAFNVPQGQVDREDLLATVGHDGRASKRFLKLYAMRMGVDVSPYKWWFHHRDDGVFAIPLVALDDTGEAIRIPLSAAMLAGFADRGRWDLTYPPHRVGLLSVWWAVAVFGICALGLGYALFLR